MSDVLPSLNFKRDVKKIYTVLAGIRATSVLTYFYKFNNYIVV